MRINSGYQYAEDKVQWCMDKNFNWVDNYPLTDGDKVKFCNPEDVIGDSYPKATDMLDRFGMMQIAAIWDEHMVEHDQADATSLPAFSIEVAVAPMEKIVDKANKWRRRSVKSLNYIMKFLFSSPLSVMSLSG
jgi:hypothetical protein